MQAIESKFIRFQNGEAKMMRFDTEVEPPVSRSRTYGTFNMDFTVYHPVDSILPKIWSAHIATAKNKVIPLLQQGFTVLLVGRTGEGKYNTRYWVKPIR